MKKIFSLTALLLIGALTLAGCGGGTEETSSTPGSEPAETKSDAVDKNFTIACLNQLDVWPIYNALKTGEGDKYGFKDLDDKAIKTFDSGMEVVEGIPAEAFQIGDVGAFPALMAALRYDAQIVGVAGDESAANAIVARPDSDVFNDLNPKYKNVYGVADEVRGKTVLTTSISSSNDTLIRWLKSMDLTREDVKVKTLEQQTAIKAFEAGDGDFLVLWAPNLYKAYEKGYKDVATAKDVGSNAPMIYVVPKKFAENNRETIANFLAMTNSQVYDFKVKGEERIPKLKKFFKEYAGIDMSDEDIQRDIDRHELFTIEDQLILMQNGTLEEWLDDTATLLEAEKFITKDELKKLQDKNYNIDDSFLLKAKTITPAS